MRCIYKIVDGDLIVSPVGFSFVTLEVEGADDIEYFKNKEYQDIADFIGSALHSLQQGVSRELRIHNRQVYAILMDQTTGAISLYDILKTNDSLRPYQRLGNILKNNFVL